MSQPLLEVRNLTVAFPLYGGLFYRQVGEVCAVDNVSFTIQKGETLGLVGESGCGKTTISRSIVNIIRTIAPAVRLEGEILFHQDGQVIDLLKLSRKQMRPLRSQIQMVFQDPFSSLNPRMTIGQLIEAPLTLHTKLPAAQRRRRVDDLLNRVGLQAEYRDRYPHEFSGGQRQRVGIARALAVNPQLMVLDEPVSALDVSVQAQVINLLQDLQEEFGLTYLFVAHDLSVVYHISDRIAVMYLGNLVEYGDAEAVYHQPAHPYSKVLLSAAPHADTQRKSAEIILQGEIPSPLDKPSGCGFRTRCPIARAECAGMIPPLEATSTGQVAACPYYEDMAALKNSTPSK